MSGVITGGVQYERCNQCAGWCRFELLAFAPLNPALPLPGWVKDNPHGAAGPVDLCPGCVAGRPWVGKYRDPALNAAETAQHGPDHCDGLVP